MTYEYDLFVIGAGPGGLAAAKQAAHYGAKVAIAEANHLGGTCANLGCIPKKLMVYAADFAHLAEAAQGYGWTRQPPTFHWEQFVESRDRALDRIRQSHQRSLSKLGIELIRDYAKFVDPHTIEVSDRKITADKILIAVGGKATKPKIPGIEHALVSDQMFHLPELPNRLAIIGGGYIGVEFSSVMRGFGVDVVLMNQENCLLNGFDATISDAVRNGLVKRGIQNYCSTTAASIERTSQGIQLKLKGDRSDTITVDAVLCAIGRAPNLEALDLEQIDLELDQKAIAVDQYSRTSQPNIYAVGDCTNRKQLTPVARAEGKAFAHTVFGNQPTSIDYNTVPSAVCSRPEAATVGMSEADAKEQFGDAVKAYQTEFVPLFHQLSGQEAQSVIKYVVDQRSDRVLGIHMVGDAAAEILQGFVLAFRKGLTKSEIDATIGIHPSSAEEFFS